MDLQPDNAAGRLIRLRCVRRGGYPAFVMPVNVKRGIVLLKELCNGIVRPTDHALDRGAPGQAEMADEPLQREKRRVARGQAQRALTRVRVAVTGMPLESTAASSADASGRREGGPPDVFARRFFHRADLVASGRCPIRTGGPI